MKTYVRRIGVVVGLLLLFGGLLPRPVRAAEFKLAYVDIQRAVNECNAGKEAKKTIMGHVEKFQKAVQDRQKELQAMKESLEKQAPMLTAEARVTKEKEYQGKLKEFQRWGEDSQNEINQKRLELERNIAAGLFKVVQKIGTDEGFTLILEKNEQVVLYVAKATDITERVIKTYDAQPTKK
jgi:outer membrane protein